MLNQDFLTFPSYCNTDYSYQIQFLTQQVNQIAYQIQLVPTPRKYFDLLQNSGTVESPIIYQLRIQKKDNH